MRDDTMTSLGHLPADGPAALAAYTAAGLGALAVASLAAMYAVEVPRGGPYVFGGINDFTGGLFYLATIPPILQIQRRLGRGPRTRAGTVAVVVCSAAAAASGVLLSLHLIGFGPSTAVSVAGIVAQAAWAALANHRLLHHPRYPHRLAMAGRAIGLGMLAALPIIGAGYLASGVPALQMTLYAAGAALGVVAYLGWPLWLFTAGRYLAGHGERAHRRGPASARPV
ncbi:hypothetical protein GCM10027449_06600 [Sinomonas notoginsengisoli]|uniref:hypothetical protein n=1 Tax=Sinomonas notoginsengisoli TaxID=1457311 RepID=UPI001F199F81|nr:hypothetical protein [Sinomonas notoginsengisoli]